MSKIVLENSSWYDEAHRINTEVDRFLKTSTNTPQQVVDILVAWQRHFDIKLKSNLDLARIFWERYGVEGDGELEGIRDWILSADKSIKHQYARLGTLDNVFAPWVSIEARQKLAHILKCAREDSMRDAKFYLMSRKIWGLNSWAQPFESDYYLRQELNVGLGEAREVEDD